MKKKFVVLFFIISNSIVISTTKNISFDFEFSETGINRALVTQFNDPNFAFKQFTGTFNIEGLINVPYSVLLKRPTIVIENDFIGINLFFTFEASLGSTTYSHQFEVTPGIIVNETSVFASNVVAFLDDLDNEINAHTEIEPAIRILLIGLYNTYEPQIYASELFNEILEEINSIDFIQQRSLKVIDFGISPSLHSDKFVIKGILTLETYDKIFDTYLKINDPGSDLLRFGSNIKCKVEQLVVWDQGQEEAYRNESLNLELVPNENYTYEYFAEINIGDNLELVTGVCSWIVLYTIDNTFYFNKYAYYSGAWKDPNIRLNH